MGLRRDRERGDCAMIDVSRRSPGYALRPIPIWSRTGGMMSMRKIVTFSLTPILTLLPAVASAHPGHGEAAGFVQGFLHPLGGLDHALAMLAIGILAYQLGGRALWMLPSVFVMAMAIGWALAVVGMQLPYVEAGIAVSVVVFGGAILFAVKSPAAICAALAGLFALFHGHAHGLEMPPGPAAPYAAGFIAATILLHVAG